MSETNNKKRSRTGRMMVCALAALIAYSGFTFYGGGGWYGFFHPLADECALNKQNAIQAVENIPVYRMAGTTVVSSGDSVKSNELGLCSADVILNTGSADIIHYAFFKFKGQSMLYAALGPAGLELVRRKKAEEDAKGN